MANRILKEFDEYQKNEKGEYVYVGEYYVPVDENEHKRMAFLQLLIAIVILILCFISGMIKAVGYLDSPIVSALYVLSLLESALFLLKNIQQYFNKLPFKGSQYERIIEHMPIHEYGLMILLVITLVSECIYILRHGIQMYFVGTIVVNGAVLVALIFAFMHMLRQRKIKWQKKL